MGAYSEEGWRFYGLDIEDEQIERFAKDDIVALVDEEDGGIVGLILRKHEKEYVDRLNRQSLAEWWGTPSERLANLVAEYTYSNFEVEATSPSGHAFLMTGRDSDMDVVWLIISQYDDEHEPQIDEFPGSMSAYQAWDTLVADEREEAE